MSFTELKEEQDLLSESSEMIIDEIMNNVREDLIEKHAIYLNEIISEHTVQLFNVLHLIRKHEYEAVYKRKLSFNDIHIWSNESESRINEIFDDNYQES